MQILTMLRNTKSYGLEAIAFWKQKSDNMLSVKVMLRSRKHEHTKVSCDKMERAMKHTFAYRTEDIL